MKPLCVFTVSYNHLRVRVKVMSHELDVHKSFPESKRANARNNLCNAYFIPHSAGCKMIGTIVIPGNLDVIRLSEVVSHEVVHAILHKLGVVHQSDDERLAYPVGQLTRKILVGVERRVERGQ